MFRPDSIRREPEWNYDEAMEVIEETLDLIAIIESECPDVWERGGEFLESVAESLTSVHETLMYTEVVTLKQETAIRNWRSAVKKWFRNGRR